MENNQSNEVFEIDPTKGDETSLRHAKLFLNPAFQATVTASRFSKGTPLDLTHMYQSLNQETKLIQNGNLNRAESMLTAQAHTLDVMFNKLAQMAIDATHVDNLDKFMKLALRAQSQARSTWETLSVIKNPPMVGYVKQANISNGPQQVNNYDKSPPNKAPFSTRKNQKASNELLEASNGKWMDRRTTSKTSSTDKTGATLETINRPKN